MNRDDIFRARFLREKVAHETLRAKILAAIQEYDKLDDHVMHASGADCTRCKCAAAIGYDKPIPIRTRI